MKVQELALILESFPKDYEVIIDYQKKTMIEISVNNVGKEVLINNSHYTKSKTL